MKAVIQRVSQAAVTVDGTIQGKIGMGFLVLLGVGKNDTEQQADMLASKIAGMRVFTDENGKMNLSLDNIDGGVLVISNFTLYADCSHGKRPSFFDAARPDTAQPLYEYFCRKLVSLGVKNVERGIFGADMQVELLNDGPVTIILDTDHL